MRTALSILTRPYPICLSYRKNLPFITGFSLLIPLFLIALEPFGLSNWQHEYKNLLLMGLGVIGFFIFSLNYYLAPIIFSRLFDEDTWNVGKEILWQLWNFATVILVYAIYWSGVLDVPLTTPFLLEFTRNGLLLTIFLMPTCVLINHNRLIREKLHRTETVNRNINMFTVENTDEPVVLVSENGKEKLTIPQHSLLFIQSYDNYANIVTQVNGGIQESLLRSSLKNLERQLAGSPLIRCHRSFIVNLSRVKAVSGNARNYSLAVENHELPIPVSRDLQKRVFELLDAQPQ